MFFLMLYITIIPFLETPMWCLRKIKESENFERGTVILDCHNMGVPFSRNPTLSPVFIAFLDFTCLSYFVFIRWFKTKWRTDSRKDRIQNIILAISVSCIVVDSTIAMALFTKPFVTCIMRPIVFGSFIHLMRQNMKHFYNDLMDSGTILIYIFIFISAYSVIGYFLFRYQYEGYTNFASLSDSYYNMIILMTTANFPDIMLPAYAQSYWVMLFFVSYLIFGLYLLMNFLLANVFNKFRDRLEEQACQI